MDDVRKITYINSEDLSKNTIIFLQYYKQELVSLRGKTQSFQELFVCVQPSKRHLKNER